MTPCDELWVRVNDELVLDAGTCQGFRPAGTDRWVESGFLDRKKTLPLSVLERQACYFMWSEPAAICQNIFLATEALGLGGWMHCGFLSLGVLEALGFQMVGSGLPGSFPNPGAPRGLRGVLPALLPDHGCGRRRGRRTSCLAEPRPCGSSPSARTGALLDAGRGVSRRDRRDQRRGHRQHQGDLDYIHATYARFPSTIDAMHLMWFIQAHHLDLDFYAKYFKAGACGRTHLAHRETWHPSEEAPSRT